MALIAIASPGDHPGCTVTAFALTLTWPSPVLLAECCTDGGQILRGYFRCHQPPNRGVWQLALATVQNPDGATEALGDQLVTLDDTDGKHLLPGLPDPFLASQLSASMWETLAGTFTELPLPVLADVGPIGPHLPWPLLRTADLVIVVMRPTLAQVAVAQSRLGRLRQALGANAPLALCVIGDRPYAPTDVRARLGDFALLLQLPADHRTAQVLSEGTDSDRARHRITFSPLAQAASRAARVIDRHVGEHQLVHDSRAFPAGRGVRP